MVVRVDYKGPWPPEKPPEAFARVAGVPSMLMRCLGACRGMIAVRAILSAFGELRSQAEAVPAAARQAHPEAFLGFVPGHGHCWAGAGDGGAVPRRLCGVRRPLPPGVRIPLAECIWWNFRNYRSRPNVGRGPYICSEQKHTVPLS